METDVLIVGGGPAGLTAACRLAEGGAKVVLVDEGFELGGHMHHQSAVVRSLPDSYETMTGTEFIEQLIGRVNALEIRQLLSHSVVGVYQNGDLGVTDGNRTFPISAGQVILATGAAEDAALFPGWTFPGVMTLGAAQLLINRERVRPGNTALIVGLNQFTLEVADLFSKENVSIAGIIEERDRSAVPEEWIARIHEERIPVYFSSRIQAVLGNGEVEKAIIQTSGGEKVMEADMICISNGMSPITDLAELLTCELTYNESLGGQVPIYNEGFETTVPSVFVIGNAAGVTCAGGLLLTAEIAANQVLKNLSLRTREEYLTRNQSLWEELRKTENQHSGIVHEERAGIINESVQENAYG
ncbi:NAD(P)/FAD-dependent oxidoreductase [Edaphobacillus lindanitolerans]|uniref:Sarcosine oxidase subunit alpha n=1 Tax=Edaphobacillus lindanitolerans TaxID=550447 RepID=A0A1U7PN17_9BACI|nr:NAD(P)/FAD-dependent oxidoreductase [Edaphobacillus lindanitolerans]SIT73259.1 sarcosine oxidase subunit alpha [Edaphobacillus lindanitolerans]